MQIKVSRRIVDCMDQDCLDPDYIRRLGNTVERVAKQGSPRRVAHRELQERYQ
jgi:hypothetical protein